MGLSTAAGTGYGAMFSEDVLKIEIQGPNVEHLTIIDVPGIFHNTVDGTTKRDMALVKGMVRNYIKDDRTIILAVIPSNVNMATQEILELAEEYDPHGERTLGVMTKPDLVKDMGDRQAICDLINGEKRPLKLGYYLVRNQFSSGNFHGFNISFKTAWSFVNSTGTDADVPAPFVEDRIFEEKPWRDLPKDRLGVDALRARLRTILVDITKRVFPQLKVDIRQQMEQCEKDLEALGLPRQDERLQHRYLSDIVNKLQLGIHHSMAGDSNYCDKNLPNLPLLSSSIRNITDVFNHDFSASAHAMQFDPELDEESPPSGQGYMIARMQALMKAQKVDVATNSEKQELGDIVTPPMSDAMASPTTKLSAWIGDQYLHQRVLTIVDLNSEFLNRAFAEQSAKWDQVTKVYMSRIILTIHRFIRAALEATVAHEPTRREIWRSVIDSLVERYREAIKQAEQLVAVERERIYTPNKQLSRKIDEAQSRRAKSSLYPKARKDTFQYGETQYMVNVDDISASSQGHSNMEHELQKIHDTLYAYYQIAMDRFLDNVYLTAVSHQLLHSPRRPFKVLDLDWVMGLGTAELDIIAGESSESKRTRKDLEKQIQQLSKAMKVLS